MRPYGGNMELSELGYRQADVVADALADQQLAGVVMLLVGGIAYLIGGLAMLGRLLQPREGAPA